MLISKSKYLAGLQCPKLLWYFYNAKDEMPGHSARTQALFDQGHDVGAYARRLFPDGILVEGKTEFRKITAKSLALLAERKPLFEAAFIHQNLYARADILEPVADNRWDIIEVKSSVSVKQINYHDLALQRYCYEGAGVPIARCHVMYINDEYVRHGEIEPGKLFRREDVTEKVAEHMNGIAARLEEMARVIAAAECPSVKIGTQCDKPYECRLKGLCWSFLPERSVATFHGMRKEKVFTLIDRGIHRVADVPDDEDLAHTQRIQRDCCRTGSPHVNAEGLKEFLGRLRFPLYFLDFETLSSAIPRYDGTRPFMHIPFQFSLHLWESFDARPVHHGYLADGARDPRPEAIGLLRTLLGERGSIIGYNVPFEVSRIKECAAMDDGYREWFNALKPRFIDLLAPFMAFFYYHPSQDGGVSIKNVLPPLTGKSYADLEIGSGAEATVEYARVTFSDTPADERLRVREALERYCELDTLGMLEIVRSFHTLVREEKGG